MTTPSQHSEYASLFVSDNLAYLETLYTRYLTDPASLDGHWTAFFHAMAHPNGLSTITTPVDADDTLADGAAIGANHLHQGLVAQVVNTFRTHGHLAAAVDPLALEPPSPPAMLARAIALSQADAALVDSGGDENAPNASPPMTLATLCAQLQATYTQSIGAEFMHLSTPEERQWIAHWMERDRGNWSGAASERRRILTCLTAAEGLEQYLHKTYVGQKRFSLEGGEAFIAAMETLITCSCAHHAEEIVIGMAHRGRLNVLVNVLGQSAQTLFKAFEAQSRSNRGHQAASGDVKYHLGFAATRATAHGAIHVVLDANPSHLEIVGPVVVGGARARQERLGDTTHDRVIPVIIHGDASLAGQGVVMEMLQMSQLRGYGVGGTIHLVINNQIGFTTADRADARSTYYCTDIAKMIAAPVFHVNGDDPDAVVFVSRLALAYRQRFKKDCFIDLICYRRWGHNEADEPAMTQPQMYQTIRAHPTVRRLYAQRLERDGVIAPGEADRLVASYRHRLVAGETLVEASFPPATARAGDQSRDAQLDQSVDTRTEPARLRALAERMTTLPQTLTFHPRVAKIFDQRQRMARDQLPIDWGFAENLTYATVVQDGWRFRLSGEDVGRGTFAHRHAILYDQRSSQTYIPLKEVADQADQVTIVDSLLSEEAVLAFEYGYAATAPHTLTLWEAQFGDFANCAQVVFDQFIAASASKWGRYCDLVILLPHGHEGQGPEHSSARLERFLQLCALDNLCVCSPTTPAQYYHMIRRQTRSPCRRPLIVMTPKSLLRHPAAVSTFQDLVAGAFQPMIVDPTAQSDQVERLVICSGKVYYDLRAALQHAAPPLTQLIRIEQLYPLPSDQLLQTFSHYAHVKTVVWCQEEPHNQGAWYHMRHALQPCLAPGQQLHYAGRPAAASPATGHMGDHLAEQHALVAQALRHPFSD